MNKILDYVVYFTIGSFVLLSLVGGMIAIADAQIARYVAKTDMKTDRFAIAIVP